MTTFFPIEGYKLFQMVGCNLNKQNFSKTHLSPPPPPVPKSTISEKTSKLSLYYRKMQQSLLFQNIYNFLKRDQVLTDF